MEFINTNWRGGLFRLWIVASIAWVLVAGWYTALPGAAKGYLEAIKAKKAIPPLIEEVEKFTKEQWAGGGAYKDLAEDPWRIFGSDYSQESPMERARALAGLSLTIDDQPAALKKLREKARQINWALYEKDKIFRPLKIIFIPPIAALMAGIMMYWAFCWIVGGFHKEKPS